MSNTYSTILTVIICFYLALLPTSCKKLVEVDPPVTNPTDVTVFQSNATAAAVLTGIYIRMIEGEGMASGLRSVSLLSGLSSDELKNYSNTLTLIQFYSNSVSKADIPFWPEVYAYIYTANAAIEGLTKSTGVTQPVKQQLMGEAYFIRAFSYFYLVNLFGDVPLHTVTDYKGNSVAARTATPKVYERIISDLTEAQQLLTDEYRAAGNTVTEERIRPNKGAATALLSRVYLYAKNYAAAEVMATQVINNAALYNLETDLNNVFLKNSKEAIWQLSPIQPQYNTYDAYHFILTQAPDFNHPLGISGLLMDAFEEGDKRRTNWVGTFEEGGTSYYFPYKYKIAEQGQPVTEYLMALRLAEQYLIRAEARAEIGNLPKAAMDLNTIRARAGLEEINPASKASMLVAIEQERRIELFSEWGHRWLDLKRTGRVDAVMATVTPLKGGTWSPNWQLYPIPLNEIQNNPNISQNPGY